MSDMNAQVILRLIDEMTGPAKKIQSTLKGIIKDVERLNKMAGKSNSKQFDGLTKGMKQADAAARKLRQTMARPMSSSGFTRPATANLRQFTTATKQANSAARSFRNALSRPVAESYIGQVASSANRATAAIGRMNQAMRRTPAGGGGGGHSRGRGLPLGGGHGGGHWGLRHTVGHAFAASGVYSAVHSGIHGITEGIKGGFEQAFDMQHTKVMLAMQGESKDGITSAVAQARKMARDLPQFTTAQHLEAIAELRPALTGGLKEAVDLAPMFQRSVGILEAVKQGAGKHAMKGLNAHGEALDLVRALEIGGLTSHRGWSKEKIEKNMASMVDGMTKAMVAFNGQIGAKDFHSAFKFARGDATNWSPKFATEILPTLANELKKSSKADASQVGNALKSMSRTVVDNVMTPQALQAWDKLGFYKPGAIDKKKWRVNAGFHMDGYQTFQENPYQFVQDYLLPHMKEKGVDVGNRKAVVAALGGLFGQRVANHIAALMATQQAIIEKDAENVRKAQGVNGMKFPMGADPTTRMQVLSSAFKDLGGALGELAMPGTMMLFKGMIDWAHSLRDSVSSSPYMKALGGRFEAMMAGIFGQRLGRRQMAGGREKDYWNAGRTLSGGWNALTSSIGKMMRFWEEAGVITGAMKTIGIACKGVSMAMDGVRGGLDAFKAALSSDFVKAVISAIKDVFSPKGAPTYGEAKKGLDAYKKQVAPQVADVGDARKALIDSLHPIRPEFPQVGGPIKLPPMVRGGSPLAKTFTKPQLPTFAVPGGGVPSPSSVMQPIANSMSSYTPMFAKGGGDAVQALANGLNSGAGAATGAMTSLLGSLATIAGAGVTIPVKLDTAGAEAKLSALMSKAGSVGGNVTTNRAQYSKSLNDTGE